MKPGIYFQRASVRTKNHFKMLIAIPSPRDIPEFKKTLDECAPEYDKVWIKHHGEDKKPYTEIRQYFLNHWHNGRKYTHLAILPDDVIINRQGIEKLVSNVQNNPDYRVMMAIFNTEYTVRNRFACTQNLPAREHKARFYNFCTLEELDGKGITTVKWCGTPFAIIDGRLIADGIVSLDNDKKWNDLPYTDWHGSSQDVVLAHELHENNIPLYIDTDVRFLHLKGLPIAEVHPGTWDYDH